MKDINFDKFKKAWQNTMVYRPADFDFENTMHDLYIAFKENHDWADSVEHWIEDWHAECDLNIHPFMLKSKAWGTPHMNGLIEMANVYRVNMGLDEIPLNK
jgi:hypothetical protein